MKRLFFLNKSTVVLILHLAVICNPIITFADIKPLKGGSSTIELIPPTIDDERIRENIKQVIRNNPELIMESVRIMQKKEEDAKNKKVKQIIAKHIQTLKNNTNLPCINNKKNNIALIIFYDYNCQYCKKFNDVIRSLVSDNDDVKVIYEPIAILSQSSDEAARFALAMYQLMPDLFPKFHENLVSSRNVDKAAINVMLSDMAIGEEEIKEINSLAKSHQIEEIMYNAQKTFYELQISGVPTVIIGDKIYQGMVEANQLQEVINQERSNSKT